MIWPRDPKSIYQHGMALARHQSIDCYEPPSCHGNQRGHKTRGQRSTIAYVAASKMRSERYCSRCSSLKLAVVWVLLLCYSKSGESLHCSTNASALCAHEYVHVIYKIIQKGKFVQPGDYSSLYWKILVLTFCIQLLGFTSMNQSMWSVPLLLLLISISVATEQSSISR